jgi:transcription antitermination factor NusG
MKLKKVILVIGGCFLLESAACQKPVVIHKLVVTGNQHAVPLYQDESDYLKYSRLQQSGGLKGMAGDIGQKFVTKEIDDQTPVKIVSSDDNGAVVEITNGPMRGQTGFVPRPNVD